MEIQLVADKNGKFHLKKDPYCTIEVETKDDFEHLQKALEFYKKYYHAIMETPHGALVDIDKIEEVLEVAQTISDGEYCGFCTEDVHDGLDKLRADTLFPSTKEGKSS